MEGAGALSASQSKDVLAELLRNGGDPAAIAKQLGFEAMGEDALVAAVDQAIAENGKDWADYVAGNDKVMGKFVGLIRKATGGNADGKAVTALLQERRTAGGPVAPPSGMASGGGDGAEHVELGRPVRRQDGRRHTGQRGD